MWLPQSAPLLVDLLLRAAQSATTRQNHPPVSTHTNCSPGLELPGIRELTHPSETSFVPSPPLAIIACSASSAIHTASHDSCGLRNGNEGSILNSSLPSLVPRPSLHVQERGSGVLSDFSCQMGQGSSPSWELESDCRMRNYMWWRRQSSTRSSFTNRRQTSLADHLLCSRHSKVGRSLLEFCKACLAHVSHLQALVPD